MRPDRHRPARRVVAAVALTAAALVSALVVALVPARSLAAPRAADPLGDRVAVEQGELAGAADGGVLRFRGIPYAAPPVGALRWAPPQPPARWTGARDATGPGPRCPQAAAPAGAPHATAASDTEDCLTLDVTVPVGTTARSGLPVLVWVHGGGFSGGSGADVDPRRLATAGPLVVVTINYRLGALGFLGLPGLAGSGAFGLLDQQAALRWVQRNVAAFGGDPRRVTLGGESAGADSVCAQLASPAGAGLFGRAILQSGGCSAANTIDVIRPGAGPGGDTWKPLPLVESAGAATATRLGCPDPADDAARALACLRALPVEALLGVTGVYWSPATGTPTVPRRPSDLVAARELRALPVLAGTTRDEGTLFTALFHDAAGTPMTESRFRSSLAAAARSRATAAGRAYRPVDRPADRVWSDVVTDRAYACPALAAHRSLGSRAPLFAYEFADPTAPATFAALPPERAGTTHGAEMAYLFDLVPGQPALTAAQRDLADRMVRSWARFVATGDPDGGGLPSWPRWGGDGELLVIGATPRDTDARPAAEFAAAHRCDLWGASG